MPELSRPQLLVYGALAVVALLLGARWIRSADSQPAAGASEPGQFAQASGAGSSSPAQPATDFESGSGGVIVHVAGAVSNPGVYRLSGDSRVIDAVKRAGGGTAKAALDSINLAAKLADGQQVVVPAKVSGGSSLVAPSPDSPGSDGPISLGSATVEQLDTIDGIGPVTAQDIIDYRDEQGGLSSVDDLDQVTGIGPATMEALRGRLQP
ncbi:hypothetical protein BH10ACT11_BH10ACT11_04020 [soil metagenome]